MPPLDYAEFHRALKKGDVRPAYYFHGDVELLKHDALAALLEAALEAPTRDFNFDRRRAADLTADEFATLALTPPMLASRRVLVIVEAEDLSQRRARAQATRAAILDHLRRPAADTVLILVVSAGEKPDTELAQACAAVAFEPLSPERLGRWMRHRAKAEGLEIDDAACAHLREAVGDDLSQLAAEIAKLAVAAQGRLATVHDVADLVGVRHGETTHDFVDAVTARRFADAVAMIPHLLEAPGASGVRLVTALGTALTGVALARALLDRGSGGAARGALFNALKATRPMGLRKWGDEAERWIADARDWTLPGLEAALAGLLRADKRLKSASLGDDTKILTDAVLAMAGERVLAA